MDARRLAILLLAFATGCHRGDRREAIDYRTVPAQPHHDADRAQRETDRAADYAARGEFDKAEQALQTALVADVSHGPAHNNLGQLYFAQGKNYLAAWEFEYAARLMPERPEPFNNLGLVYERVGKLDQAIDYYEAARAICPHDVQTLGNLARTRIRRGDQDDDTRQLLEELLMRETRPDWREWVEEQLALGRATTAADQTERSERRTPSNPKSDPTRIKP